MSSSLTIRPQSQKIIKSISRAPSVVPVEYHVPGLYNDFSMLHTRSRDYVIFFIEYTWICIMVSHDINLNLHRDWHMTTKVICYGQYGH